MRNVLVKLNDVIPFKVSMPITALGYAQPASMCKLLAVSAMVSMPITALGYAQPR